MQGTIKTFSFICLILVSWAQNIHGGEEDSELLPVRTSEGISSLSYRFNLLLEEKVYYKFKEDRKVGLMVLEVDFRNQKVFFLIYSEESQKIHSGWGKKGEFLHIAPEILGRNEIYLEGVSNKGVELVIRGATSEIPNCGQREEKGGD